MRNRSNIHQIAYTGIVTAIAVLLGVFANFSVLGGHVYLIGIIIFIMPIILKIGYSLIGCIISVLLTDLLTGWIQFTWISIIAYVTGLLIIFIFSLFKLKILFVPGILLASIMISLIYFSITYLVIGKSFAISTLLSTLIQFSIVTPITIMIYTPIKILIGK